MKKVLCFLISTTLTLVLFLFPMSASAATSSSTAGIVSVSTGSLNVRGSSSSTSTVLATLSKGSYVTLLSKSGSWWYVEYAAGKYGYCSSTYIQTVSSSYAAYANITSGSLNVRSGPATTYGIQSLLTKNTYVVVLSKTGSWSRILYNGTSTGYVSSSYLSTYSTSSTASYPAIALSVPSYKQTDSRWSSYPIGSTGGTIATIGCATTALAMTESYRTGTTITPNAMVSKLSYTTGGSVYWPSNYTFITSYSLETIYSYLKAGKPVIYGSKNSSGGQHWVVITGYTGGSSLTTAGFTVNDPGSSSRTTLQQYLASYPYFYKYAVY